MNRKLATPARASGEQLPAAESIASTPAIWPAPGDPPAGSASSDPGGPVSSDWGGLDAPPLPALLSGAECVALSGQLALFFERFGFRRSLGRIWATLFLSPRPLSQAQLAAHLGISTGLVSSGLKELAHFEMIHSVARPGARRVHYEAEVRLLRIVQSILAKREVPAVRALHETVRAVRVLLGGRLDAESEHLPKRLESIEAAARLYTAMARLVMAIAHLPPLAVDRAVKLVEGLRLGGWSEESRVVPPPPSTAEVRS